MRWYNYLKDKGYDEDYCNICLTHSYLNNDIICIAGGIPDINENRKFNRNWILNNKLNLDQRGFFLGHPLLYISFCYKN